MPLYIHHLNLFLANVPILYPLKTPENQRFSGVFRGYKMGTLTRNGLNNLIRLVSWNCEIEIIRDIKDIKFAQNMISEIVRKNLISETGNFKAFCSNASRFLNIFECSAAILAEYWKVSKLKSRFQILLLILTHFSTMFHFHIPGKRQKTFDFLTFPRV